MSGIQRGQRVGRYELVQVLGEGGMGTVWLAHPEEDAGQLYAVKMVSAEYAADPRVCGMFVKEAMLAAALDHPNIARLYDVGIHDNSPFFVMEWIDGWSLREVAHAVVDSGERVPPSIALRLASDLCAGLHAAHELVGEDGSHLGLVHRDVSPHNVLVTRDGIAKLIDFGVAKARDVATGAEGSVVGGLKGKVRYMAPEQALEKEVDRRADLFSVGAVIYQLLTGRVPFEGPNELAVINALLSTNPVFVPEDLPEPVQWILRRALARRPEQRFTDAAEMRDAIEHALVDLGAPDTHADVVACLSWFVPLDEQEEETELRGAVKPTYPAYEEEFNDESSTALRSSVSSPLLVSPLAPPPDSVISNPLSRPLTADAIPARQPSLLLGLGDDLLAQRQPFPVKNEGSLRFVLLGAAFVGLLGIGAALLVHDGPRRTATTRPAAVTTEIDNAQLPAAVPTVLPASVATSATPITDLGDLDDGAPPTPSTKRPRPQKRQATSLPPKNPYDIAGPVKVWK